MSNAGNIKSPFNIFTSGGENDEVSCFLIMHSRAPEPRNSRLGAGIPPPGKAALLVPRFLPLFLPSLSPSTALTRSSSSTNLPFRHRVSTISTLIFFHFPFFFRFSRIAYISFSSVAWRAGVILAPLPPPRFFSLVGSTRRRLRTRPLVPLPPPNFPLARGFSCLSFCVLSSASAIFPFLHPSIPLSIRAVPFFKVSHLPRQSHFLPDFANPSVSKNRGFEFPRIVFPPLSNDLVLSLLLSLSFLPRYLFPAQSRLISVFFFLLLFLLLFLFPLSFRSNLSIFIPPPLFDLATNSPPSQRAFKSRSSSREREGR